MGLKITQDDIGQLFLLRDGSVIKCVGWDKRDDVLTVETKGPLGFTDFYTKSGKYYVGSNDPHPWDMVQRIHLSKQVQRTPKRGQAPIKSQKEDKQMKKQSTPVKYFVGKLDKVAQGSPYRIFRRTTKGSGLMKRVVEELSTAKGWVKTKVKYKQSSNLLTSRAAAREEKRKWEGRK